MAAARSEHIPRLIRLGNSLSHKKSRFVVAVMVRGSQVREAGTVPEGTRHEDVFRQLSSSNVHLLGRGLVAAGNVVPTNSKCSAVRSAVIRANPR